MLNDGENKLFSTFLQRHLSLSESLYAVPLPKTQTFSFIVLVDRQRDRSGVTELTENVIWDSVNQNLALLRSHTVFVLPAAS